jgi:hypothetical protein
LGEQRAIYTWALFKQIFSERSFETLVYLTLILQIFIIYGVGLLAESVLYLAFQFTIKDFISKYPIFNTWFERFEIGLGFLALVGFLIHSIISVYSQIQFEISTTLASTGATAKANPPARASKGGEQG